MATHAARDAPTTSYDLHMIERPRPLNILHTLRSVRIDGVVRVVLRYIAHFDDPRFRHFVCSMRDEDHLADAFRSHGVDPVFIGHRHPAGAPASVARIARLMRDLDIDLVHTNRTLDLLLAGTAARLRGIPVVASFHWLGRAEDHPEDRAPWAIRKGHERVVGLLNRMLADRVIAVSDAVRDGLADVAGFPIDRTDVVYPGIPMDGGRSLDPTACATLRHGLGVENARPLLLNIGRLEAVKGQRHLLPMMRRVRQAYPEAVLLIAGEGSLRPSLERDIRDQRLEGAVVLLGSRSDIDELLSISDMLVLASESEAAPLPPVEAMRVGRPVVATAVGGVSEIVTDGITGLVVDRADPDALANAVMHLAADPARALAMGEAGRRLAASRFDISRSLRELSRIYLALAGRRHEPAPPIPARTGLTRIEDAAGRGQV